MIAVVCGECGESFEFGEESAGLTEYCPNCGALIDIPDPEALSIEVAPLEEADESAEANAAVQVIAPPVVERGISSRLWWTIFISGIAIFIGALVYLFSDNWEARNLQLLSDATNRGDVLMADGDFVAAAKQYQTVLETVGHRTIESAYILQLIDHARREATEAQRRMKLATTTQPAARRAAVAAQPAPENPEIAYAAAMKIFQRDYEAFPAFVRTRPLLFMDGSGQWRRREFVVWQAEYNSPTLSASPQIVLKYNFASRITAAHAQQAAATVDNNFIDENSLDVVHCQTMFRWAGGHWTIVDHQADVDGQQIAPEQSRFPLREFYPIERAAFGAGYQ